MNNTTNILIFLVVSINSYSQGKFTIHGYVADTLIDSRLENSLIQLISDQGEIINTHSEEEGVFNFDSVSIAHDYILLADKKGYLWTKERIAKTDIHTDSVVHVILILQRIKRNHTLPSIQFETDSYYMDSIDYKAIEAIKELMLENPNITVGIGGHRDSNETTEISGKRSEIIEEELIKMGIHADRLFASDYGNSKPACVDYQMKMQNPGLDLDSCLTKSYLMTVSTALQNSISRENRRVEFIILRTDYKE